MKQIKTILALLLCLCMLPFSTLAAAADDGALQAMTYTPTESGLYAVTVQKGDKTLDPLPAKEGAVYDPVMAVSVKAGETEAQAVDYNVFYLVKGTAYTVQLQKLDETYDDSGDWTLNVEKVNPTALTLNADTLTAGEWFSFTPDADGDYTIVAATAPVFVEVMTVGAPSGNWAGYALDKEKCRVGMELDYLRSLMAAIAGREAALKQAEDTHQKALDKIANYEKLEQFANSPIVGKKQDVYKRLKDAMLRGDEYIHDDNPIIDRFLSLFKLPKFDTEAINALPEKVTDLPDYVKNELQVNSNLANEAKARLDELREQQAADQARYNEGIAANPQLEALLKDTSVETAALRQQVQTDADAIMGSASAFAVSDGMQLVAAHWQNDENGKAVELSKDVTYIIHALSNLETSAAVTDGTAQPEPTVDKTALQNAIAAAEGKDTSKYTDDSVAAMTQALNNAKAVNSKADATQDEVDNAAKALNDAVAALKEKENTPPTVDKTALQSAIVAAEGKDTSKYTDDSVAAMTQALNNAKAVNSKADATQTEVNAAAQALNDAIQALKEKEVTPPTPTVDKTALDKAIADAKAAAKETDKYTAESLAALAIPLLAATTVSLKSNPTQEEVDKATSDLNAALDALVEKEPATTVDKTALQSAITAAEAVDTSKYTDDSVAAMTQALNNAKAVNDKADATQDEVNAAAKALNDAVAALQVKPVTPTVDKTALQSAITAAEGKDKTKYTDDSVAAMTQALSNAKAVNGKADATQAEVDAAAKALNDAVAALKEKEESTNTVDKSELKKALDAAAAIDRGKYTADSLKTLDSVVKYAQGVYNNDKASQTLVNNAVGLVNLSMEDLKEKGAQPQPSQKCDGGANCPSKVFKDVDQTKWYHEAVDYAIVNNLFNGTSPTTFAPNDAMTRGMLVTVLYRMEKEPGAKTTPAFTDLKQTWYKDAVAWAAENEIVNGIDPTHFAPEAKVTREQAMTMLMRYAQFKGLDVSARDNLAAFSDSKSVSVWALDAMQWAVKVGLIQGVTPTKLDPRGNSTRAQVATILMRFQENIAK